MHGQHLLLALQLPFAASYAPTFVGRSMGWQTALSASVYYPGGYSEEESDFGYQEQSHHAAVKENISRGAKDSLARLAVAFSPQGHGLALNKLENVDIMNLEDDRMDIEALVCENEGCVSVAVPISFPTPCTGEQDVIQDCVMRHMNELDMVANEFLKTVQWKDDNHEQVARDERFRVAVSNADDVEVPSWWIPGGEMSNEGKFLCSLLNDDEFQRDIAALVKGQFGQSVEVQQAAVAAIGPAGMIVRSIVEQGSNVEMVDVPIQFSSTADSVDTLRAMVLDTVGC